MRRYKPGDAGGQPSAGRKLPQTSYVTILEGNALNAVKRISETQKEVESSKHLTEQEAQSLNDLAAQLDQSPKDPHPTDKQTNALLKVATTWPSKARVPAVALLARLAVSPSFVNTTSAGNDELITTTLASAGLLSAKQPTANNAVHAIRLIANLFASDTGRLITDGTFEQTLQSVRQFASEPESSAQSRALATLYLNYAVQLTSQAPSEESRTREQRAQVLIRDIAFMLECESPHASDGDALFRALCALGTLVTLGEDFRQQMKGGLAGTLHFVNSKPAAQRQDVKEVVQEIRDELR